MQEQSVNDSINLLKQLKKTKTKVFNDDFDFDSRMFGSTDRKSAIEPSQDSLKLAHRSTVALKPKKDNMTRPQELLDMQEGIIDSIHEVEDEIDLSRENVTSQAKDHINENDLILTFSYSNTLSEFLIEASKTHHFEVIVLETAPTFEGHKMAKILAEAGIQTNLCQDSAAFALMSRVDKVMISSHGVMANGGLIAASGSLMIAHAAKASQVPVFVLSQLYKFTPLHPVDSLTFNEFLQPEKIFRLKEHDVPENIDVIVPKYDYVPPKLISLILTNCEAFTPENIYRAFNSLYGQQGTHEMGN